MDAVNGARGFELLASLFGCALRIPLSRSVLMFLPILVGLGRFSVAVEPGAADSPGAVEVTAQKPAIGDSDMQAGGAAELDAAKPKVGKLVICGGGALPDELGRRFIELAGGDAARLVIITTASVLADTDRVETKLAFWRRQPLAELAVMHTRSRETANQPEFVKPLKKATGVWFIGGNQNWLT